MWALPLILLTGFVSAAFSLSEVFDNIDSESMLIFFTFMISFALIYFSAYKSIFKENKPTAGVIALVSAFAITWGVNKMDFDLSNFIYDIGIPEETLSILIPLLAAALAIFLIIRLKTRSFLIFGAGLILLAFFVEEAALLIAIGVILLTIGLFALSKKKDDPITKIGKTIGSLLGKK